MDVFTGIGHNGIVETARPFLVEIENLLDRLESHKGEFMALCKSLRNDIRNVYKRAKDRGVEVRPLKTLVKTNGLTRTIKRTIEELDLDERRIYNDLAFTLGYLGIAAQRRAGYGVTVSNAVRGVEIVAGDTDPAEDLAKFGDHIGRP